MNTTNTHHTWEGIIGHVQGLDAIQKASLSTHPYRFPLLAG
jgi:hypothetical protein